MINRDYAKEVGLESSEKRIGLPWVVLLLLALGLLGWWLLPASGPTS